jgi:hypothetical protein
MFSGICRRVQEGKSMSDLNFQQYKDNLKIYLSSKGHKVNISPTFCINPNHTNDTSPAMVLHDDGFKCMSCGQHGDIYDACELLTGITDKREQYLEVERVIKGFNPQEIKTIQKKSSRVKFVPDEECVKKFMNYVGKHKAREKAIKAFLKERGYSPNIVDNMWKKFGYWGGFQEATKIISKDDLLKAGIPEKAWYHPGVVVRLGFGFKLMWYGKDAKQNYGCQKRNSLSAVTFPTPRKELSGHINIVEGELSAMSMIAGGFENTHSCGGTNGITKNNVNKLLNCDSVTFLFDGDNAGRYYSHIDPTKKDKVTGDETTPKTPIQKLWDASYNGKVYSCNMPDEEDPDDFMQRDQQKELSVILQNRIEIVKPAPEKPKESKHDQENKTDDAPFHFLGYDSKAYYILPKSQQIPLKITRGDASIKNWLFEIASESWWMIGHSKEVDEKIVLDTKSAIEWFRQENFRAGIFDMSKIKGTGCYMDKEDLILNTGQDLKICGKNSKTYREFSGEKFYVRSKQHLKIGKKPWNIDEGQKLYEAVSTFNFSKNIDKIAVMGYMALAPFSSVLFRRPNIWLTAQKGVGKSYLLETLIVPAVGGNDYALFTEGLSSEAYIRQKTINDNLPIIIDEFEPKDMKSKGIVGAVLKLLTSSYDGKFMGKGTSGHEAIDFTLRTMFCFGSVNVRIENAAELSRIHVCRMQKSNGICRPPKDFEGFRKRIFLMLPKIISEIDICTDMILDSGLSKRTADTYSPFLVGFWNIVSDNEFMKDDTDLMGIVAECINELQKEENQEDEDKVIERILKERVKVDPTTEVTIAEMLINFSDNVNFNSILPRHGIKIMNHKQRKCLAISLNSPDIKKILVDTPFSDYKEIVQRHKLVVNPSYSVTMAGSSTRCVLLDFEEFNKRYFKDEEG